MLFNFRCRASDDCDGFLIDYSRNACFRVDSNSDDDGSFTEDLQPTDEKVNYFRKICLQGKSS